MRPELGNLGAMQSVLADGPVPRDLLLSLQASHGNSAVGELLRPVQRVPGPKVKNHPTPTHHAPAHKPPAHKGPAHHAPAHAAPSKQQENPTYAKASRYVEKYFGRQAEKATVLAELKDHAVQKFKEVTGDDFNTQAPGGLEILWGVLQIVPTAGPLLTTLGELKDGAKFLITIKKVGEDLKKVEEAGKVGEPIKGGIELAKKGSEATEKHESAAFVIEKINNLDDLRVTDVGNRWKKEDIVDKLLDDHEYDPPDVDLLGQLQQQLGKIDDSDDLQSAAKEVRTKFELELYADFYRKKGAKFVILGLILRTEFIDGIPDEAKQYIMKLGNFSSERALASAFRLPIHSELPQQPDPNDIA